jgi:hypothetical protein
MILWSVKPRLSWVCDFSLTLDSQKLYSSAFSGILVTDGLKGVRTTETRLGRSCHNRSSEFFTLNP